MAPTKQAFTEVKAGDQSAALAPAARPGWIPRSRLNSRLRDANSFRLVLVRAPAGYGKTSLLRQWAAEDERKVAWLTLRREDDRPTRLLNRVVEAIDSVSSRGRRFVVVVDDAQVLRKRASWEALENVIASLPEAGQLALASRREPMLPLGRMRARRELFEIGLRDLRMNREETAALLESIGLELSPGDRDTIYQATQGWPAALYLAGLSLSEGDGAVESFGGDDRFVADYFRDEFMANLSPARLRFLTRASVLEELEGRVCDDVLERSGSGRVLKELARANLPLEPLDHADGAYRLHPLFRQALRAELHRREPDVETHLNTRASAWSASHDRFEAALEYALAAGDEPRAAELIWARAAPYLSQGDREGLRRWLDGFSDRKLAGSPELALAAAHLYLALGEGEAGTHWATVAQELYDEDAADDPEFLADLLILRATLPTRGIEQMRKDAVRAGELHPPESTWRAISYFYAGASSILLGDLQEGREQLEEGARRGAVTGPIVQVFSLAQLTLLALDRNDQQGALRLIEQAREQVERFSLDEYPVMANTLIASALVHAREGRISEAVADRKRALRLLEVLDGYPDWYLAEARIFLARASMLLDGASATRALLREAATFVNRVPDSPTLARWLGESVSMLADTAPRADRAELTPAELRTLQFLPSHLSFREIASRSFVSQNTVKTQAQAIYRKLGASSRAEAVELAGSQGLLTKAPHE